MFSKIASPGITASWAHSCYFINICSEEDREEQEVWLDYAVDLPSHWIISSLFRLNDVLMIRSYVLSASNKTLLLTRKRGIYAVLKGKRKTP